MTQDPSPPLPGPSPFGGRVTQPYDQVEGPLRQDVESPAASHPTESCRIFAVMVVSNVTEHGVQLLAEQPPEGLLPKGCHFTGVVPSARLDMHRLTPKAAGMLTRGAHVVIELVSMDEFHDRPAEVEPAPEAVKHYAKPGAQVGSDHELNPGYGI